MARDRFGRTVNTDDDLSPVTGGVPGSLPGAKPNALCMSLYAWNGIGEFFKAWTKSGLRSVGCIVFARDYTSRSGFLSNRHEQAYPEKCAVNARRA